MLMYLAEVLSFSKFCACFGDLGIAIFELAFLSILSLRDLILSFYSAFTVNSLFIFSSFIDN